jgi:hypothetical protein
MGQASGAGVILLYASLIMALSGMNPLTWVLTGLVVAAGGAGLLSFGITMLRSVQRERLPFNQRMDELQKRLDDFYRPAEPPPYDPRVPVPPPQTVGLPSVTPTAMLAVF